MPIAAAASQQDPGLSLVFGLCLHQQWPNILSLQTAEADVGMEILLVHFTAEEPRGLNLVSTEALTVERALNELF